MKYYYSAKNNAFYPAKLVSSYEDSGSWPEDAIEVDDEVYNEFSAEITPEGKVRIAGESGMPVWDDFSPQSKELVVAFAENKRRQLLNNATSVITMLQDAVDLGIATNQEVNSLLEWKKYRVLLSRVDVSATRDIIWPEEPKDAG
ncbi:TPA: tail fiber assembly protein [Enterobacter asburiae]|nr:tail fiber assembly protein [Enterobacter asburiae]